MLEQLQAGLPPGAADLGPEWAITGARDAAKALYQQAGRLLAPSGQRAQAVGADGLTYRQRKNLKRKAAKDKKQQGGGGGGGEVTFLPWGAAGRRR